MAKIITTNFCAMHDALNRVIIAEVKAALRLLPGNQIESENKNRTPLCRIVVSPGNDYLPIDLPVRRVWMDEEGLLLFSSYEARCNSTMNFDEYDDLLNIIDFQYLIEQIADSLPNDKTYNLFNIVASPSRKPSR